MNQLEGKLLFIRPLVVFKLIGLELLKRLEHENNK